MILLHARRRLVTISVTSNSDCRVDRWARDGRFPLGAMAKIGFGAADLRSQGWKTFLRNHAAGIASPTRSGRISHCTRMGPTFGAPEARPHRSHLNSGWAASPICQGLGFD